MVKHACILLRAAEMSGPDMKSDSDLLAYARSEGVSGFLFVGGDAQSFVTPDLKLRGVAGLRVYDASLGDLRELQTVMAGEKCAATVMQEALAAQS